MGDGVASVPVEVRLIGILTTVSLFFLCFWSTKRPHIFKFRFLGTFMEPGWGGVWSRHRSSRSSESCNPHVRSVNMFLFSEAGNASNMFYLFVWGLLGQSVIED